MANFLFDLDKETPIISMEVFQDQLIFCDDKRAQPYKININRAIEARENDESNPNYYETSNDVLLIKAPPPEPVATRVIIDDDINFLRGEPYQFAARYEYEDGEVSAFSPLSGTVVEVEDTAEVLNDGATGYAVAAGGILQTFGTVGLNITDVLTILRTDDGFASFRTIQLEQPSSLSTDIQQMRAVDTNEDGSRLLIVAYNYAYIVDMSSVLSPRILVVFPADDLTSDEGAGFFWGGVMSRNGQTTLLAREDGSANTLRIYKVSNPITSEVQRVYEINSGDINTHGRRICMSGEGSIVYAGGNRTVAVSANFGESNSWSAIELPSGRVVVSLCCSQDGNIAYCLATNARSESADEVYVFKTVDRGSTWVEVYADLSYRLIPRNIDCSSNGRVVAFVTDGVNDDNSSRVYVSSNEGGSFQRRATEFNLRDLTDVTVSTTGRRITVSGHEFRDNEPRRRDIVMFTSQNTGASFTNRTFSNIDRVAPIPPIAVTSVNNEASTVGSKGLNNINNSINAINISYNTGNKHVSFIDIAMRVAGRSNYFRIDRVDKTARNILNNINANILFRNDGSYPVVAQRNVLKQYDNVPLRAKCFDLVQNSLVFANYTDGRSLEFSENNKINALVEIRNLSFVVGGNKGLKTNTVNEYGVVYMDDFNRQSAVVSIGTVAVSNSVTNNNVFSPIKLAKITIRHRAPLWATKYKLLRKPLFLDYDIIDGFDSVRVINNEIYLEVTSFANVVPRANDILELFSEPSVEASNNEYIIRQGSLTVPILRYIDETQTGTQNVTVELESGGSQVRVDSSSSSRDTSAPIPRGRYIVISPPSVEEYTARDIETRSSNYLSSVFYILRRSNIEDERIFQEIPGEYNIINGNHQASGGSGEQNQTGTDTDINSDNSPAILNLDNDYDVVWGLRPLRETYKYSDTIVLSNLGRVNAVSENSREIDRFASLIASEAFVDDTNINGLSSFNLSLIPFKDLDKQDGEINFVNAEDTNIEVYQEDKISKVLYRKNVLTTADGARQVTQTEDIWGEQIRSIDEYGMSHSFSYAEWGGYRYYVDAKRGVVLRKASDGQTEISSYGLLDYFHDVLSASQNSFIQGYYEPKYNNYCIVIGNSEHLSFAERNTGWESRRTWFPERIINDGFNVFSFSNGRFYRHDSIVRNEFYGDVHNSTISLVFNESNDVVKTINALMVNGNRPSRITITTENQRTEIAGSNLEETEDLFYSDVMGDSNDQGRNPQFAGIVERNTTSTIIPLSVSDPKSVHVGDVILKNGDTLVSLGKCTAISDTSITLDTAVTVNQGDLLIASEENNINADTLKGRVIRVMVVYNSTSRILLNSIQLEADASKQ